MVFNSAEFILFYIFCIMIYYLIPKKGKKLVLLIIDFGFLYSFGLEHLISILVYTVIIYLFGISLKQSKKKAVIFIGLLVLYLFIVKYSGYILNVINGTLNTNYVISVFVSIGISYYIFSGISYLIDIYKGMDPEYNYINLMSWIMFFPKIIAGPIERYSDFENELKKEHEFDYDQLKTGLIITAYGMFLKMVIADRLAIYIDKIYDNLDMYSGFVMIITVLCYSIQIYADFCGYSYIALGVSKTFGFKITNNFKTPYLSQSVGEFWRRWHISLSSWLKDYIYIPLGGSRCSIIKNYRNIIITFIISGIWHGVGIHYIVWGALHGSYQVLQKHFKITSKVKHLNIAVNYVLVSIAWIFFRADSTRMAIKIIKRCFDFNDCSYTDFLGIINLEEFIIIFISLVIMMVIDICLYKNIDLISILMRKNTVIRWCVYYILIFGIVIFGVYGTGYNVSDFIYLKY